MGRKQADRGFIEGQGARLPPAGPSDPTLGGAFLEVRSSP